MGRLGLEPTHAFGSCAYSTRRVASDFGLETAEMFSLMTSAKSDARIWWLETGRERCSSCGHAYVYETASIGVRFRTTPGASAWR